jgi:hypothetical protein
MDGSIQLRESFVGSSLQVDSILVEYLTSHRQIATGFGVWPLTFPHHRRWRSAIQAELTLMPKNSSRLDRPSLPFASSRTCLVEPRAASGQAKRALGLSQGFRRGACRTCSDQIPSSQIATMVPSVARPLMVHPVAQKLRCWRRSSIRQPLHGTAPQCPASNHNTD